MKPTPIEQEKRDRRQDNWQLSSLLSQYSQHQFQTTLSNFAKASLAENSPLNQMLKVGFINAAHTMDIPHNPADINTAGLKPLDLAHLRKEDLRVAPDGAESLSSLQIQGALSGSIAQRATEQQALVQEASQKYGVPVALVNAVIRQESAFNPSATSHCGAMGLMQLMPATAKAYGCENAYDARQNVMAGTRFLSDLLKMYKGDVELALAGYNAGPGNVAKYGNQVPPFRETKDYVVKVQGYYQSNLAEMERGQSRFTQLAATLDKPKG